MLKSYYENNSVKKRLQTSAMSEKRTLLTVTCSTLTSTGINGVKNSLNGQPGRRESNFGGSIVIIPVKTVLPSPITLNPFTYLL